MATVRTVFDVAAPNCRIKAKALKILKQKGLSAAIDFLLSHPETNVESLKMLDGMNTRDPNEEVTNAKRDLQR